MFIVSAILHSFRRWLPFQFRDLYRFEVNDFNTHMILNDSNGRKVHSMFLSVCFFSAILFIQDLLRDLTEPAKKAKINKHRGQLTCPRAQPHFQIRLAPKFQDGAGNKRSELNFVNGRHYILPTKTTSIERDWDWILDTLWHVIPTKDAYDVLYSPLGDSPFFCFQLYYIWEIAFSPTKDEYNEYNRISANIIHEVLKDDSDISWGYVIHI